VFLTLRDFYLYTRLHGLVTACRNIRKLSVNSYQDNIKPQMFEIHVKKGSKFTFLIEHPAHQVPRATCLATKVIHQKEWNIGRL